MRRAPHILTMMSGGGVAYRLRDRFGLALAAGALNASPADPGPGLRAVTDTENKLSIAGGALVCAGGKAAPATGDPGLWWPSLSRAGAVGIVLLCSVTTSGGADLYIGWDSNQATTLRFGWKLSGANAAVYDPTTYPALVVAPHADGTAYDLAVVLRSAATGGQWYFRRAPGEPWKLYYVSQVDGTATMYPGVANNNRIFTLDELRIPEARYVPAPLVYDSFTRADGAIGSSETAGPDGQGVTARTWNATGSVGTWAVATNKAACSALSSGVGLALVTLESGDVVGALTVTRAGGTAGAVLRYVDADNYLRLVYNGANVQLVQRLAGVESTLVNVAKAAGAGLLMFALEGDKLDIWWNHTVVGAQQTLNAAFAASTHFGIYTDDVTNTLDTFTLWPRGTGGEHVSLGAL